MGPTQGPQGAVVEPPGVLHPLVRTRVSGASAVALTFDDGPDPTFTPRVLDALGELGVQATFFLIGERAHAHRDLVRRIVAEGHAVGSHSLTHPEPGQLGWQVVRDFRMGRRAVERAAGRRVQLFRPPKGHLDRQELAGIVASRVEPWLWTIDPEDWRPGATPDDILQRLGPVDVGDVVLLHDAISRPLAPEALDRSATVAALPGIVASVRERGLELVPLAVT